MICKPDFHRLVQCVGEDWNPAVCMLALRLARCAAPPGDVGHSRLGYDWVPVVERI